MVAVTGRNGIVTALGSWALVLLILSALYVSPVSAQQDPPEPGDAFATRFSGTTDVQGPDGATKKVIDVNGVVGSLIGITTTDHPPSGHHWTNETQSLPVTAGQAGQVFGIAIDDADPPSIYLSATSAYGLHPKFDKSDWMAGMWGEGGAGGIYRLNPQNDYKPELFSIISLEGRPNSGASLGNIAYDRWNKQLYVSDLETGMIHKIDTSNGAETGRYDHGVQGRQSFIDAATGEGQSLPAVAFDPASTPRYGDCPSGDYTRDPACWNVADFRRRVWGLGVYRDPATEQVRVFYAVWGSQSFGNGDWDAAGDDQRNSVWSVAIDESGNFDISDIRREFLIPGFFAVLEDFQRAGGSHPVSDIAFSSTGGMLLAERGGLRNLGLDQEEAFATPRESRVLRYQRNDNGVWELSGRDDVGFYDRKNDNPPYLRAGSSGGVDFGFGYTDDWQIDPGAVDEFIWIAGDGLCSPEGPCYDPETNNLTDTSHVSGLQGGPADITGDVIPEAALKTPYPEPGPATPPTGALSSYMIDLDQNVDDNGAPIPEEMTRNDATRGGGDVEVYKPVVGAPPLQPGAIHLPIGSQPGVAPPSYGHFPPGSTHWPPGTQHWPPGSHHWPVGSGHWPQDSGHWPKGSGHWPKGSKHLGTPSIHWPPGSIIHKGKPSIHWPPGSKHLGKPSLHFPPGSIIHKGKPSFHFPPGSFHKNKPSLHVPPGSVHLGKPSLHFPPGSKHLGKPSLHFPPGSIIHKGKPSLHFPPGSLHKGKPSIHFPPGSKIHKGKPSLHFPPGSLHKGKPSLHFPPGSKVHFPPGSKIHLPPGSKVHVGKPSLHFPPGSKVHFPPGSVHKGKPSLHFPPGSKVHKGKPSIHFPPGSKVHKGKPSIHFPPGSKVIHTPPGSKVHKGKPSIHFPPGSAVHKLPASPHLPPGSKVHKGKPSIHFPPGSKVHTPPGSKVHTPPGSKVHKGKPSIHFPPGSAVHKLPASPHLPPGSKVHKGKPSLHFPPGSKKEPTHKPPGSLIHKAPASPLKPHLPPGSKVHTPPGSKVHLPPGSKVHLPPGSAKKPPVLKKKLPKLKKKLPVLKKKQVSPKKSDSKKSDSKKSDSKKSDNDSSRNKSDSGDSSKKN